MKILFIVPPYRTTDVLVSQLYPMPLGAVILGTILQNNGHTVIIKDFLKNNISSKVKQPESFKGLSSPPYLHFGDNIDDCLDWINNNINNFDVVCLATQQCNLFETVEIIGKFIKSKNKPLVIGGAFATTATQEAIERTQADVCVVGEGENSIEEACQMAFKNQKGTIYAEPVDITKTPVPNWNLINLQDYPKYKNMVRGVLTVSRGCPNSCTFCSVWTITSRKYRTQDKSRIKKELLNLFNCGVRYFCFLDDNLFISENRTNEILEAIKELDTEIIGFSKCKFYVEEGIEIKLASKKGLLKKIKDKRFENIALGLETANSNQRKKMKKPFSEAELELAINECKQSGIIAKAFYIIGFPFDTIDTVCEDFIKLSSMGLSTRANNLKLYPSTDITNEYIDKKYIDNNYDWRLSSWYTPTSTGLEYKDIKKLKTVLGAIGKSTEEWGINVFYDNIDTIIKKMSNHKYYFNIQNEKIVVKGDLYRPTALRKLIEIILIRKFHKGAITQIEKDKIVGFPVEIPKDNVQLGILKAIKNNGCFI